MIVKILFQWRNASILCDVAVRQACLASTSQWLMLNLAFPLVTEKRTRPQCGKIQPDSHSSGRTDSFSHGFKLLCPPCGQIAIHPWQNDTTSCLSSSITNPPPSLPVEALLIINHPEVSLGRRTERWDCLGGCVLKISAMQAVCLLFILTFMLWLSTRSGSLARSGRLVKMDAAWPARPSDAATLWTSVA